jgi:hypothetical protein
MTQSRLLKLLFQNAEIKNTIFYIKLPVLINFEY